MPVISSIRKVSDLFFDVHLMMKTGALQHQAFCRLRSRRYHGTRRGFPHLHRTIQSIHAAGVRAGVALNPATPLSVLDYVLEDIDMVLIMTVNPGFGGQSYIPAMTGKIRTLRELPSKKNPDLLIEVDGGINTSTIRTVLEAGANVCVAGSAVFSGDRTEKVKGLLDVMKGIPEFYSNSIK